MKHAFSVLAVIATLVASGAAGADPLTQDVATGIGAVSSIGQTFSFDAHSGPSGENPAGTITFTQTTPFAETIEAAVTCLLVQGNKAQIGGQVTSYIGPPGASAGVYFNVTDNGTPGAGADTFKIQRLSDVPFLCAFIDPNQQAISIGEIEVGDNVPATPVPATLTLSPPADTNPVGTTHVLTPQVSDASSNPVAGVIVRISVTADGSPVVSGTCTTDPNGQCTFGYIGPTTPRVDAIDAYADSDGDAIQDAGEPAAAATKTWVAGVPVFLLLTPGADVNAVGTVHTVTATVADAVGATYSGVVVRFSVSGSVTTSGTCTTDASSMCSFSYTGPLAPGSDLIAAYADVDNDGVQDVGEPFEDVTKLWILPTSTPGEVHGGGSVSGLSGGRIAFGFQARSTDAGLSGSCQIVDQAADKRIRCLDVTALVVVGNAVTIYGNALDDGMPTAYVIMATDNGNAGAGADTFSISTGTGYSSGGALAGGNVHVND